MASGPFGIAPRYLATLFHAGTAAGLRDGELLDRFAARRGEDEEAAEVAFAALVERHGPMVLSTCCAVLGDRHQAEDAFQATFLVLASRAQEVRREGSIGPWLHGVALRVAACARSRAARRRRHERRYAEMAARTRAGDGIPGDGSFDERDGVLHQEIGRLPDKYRAPVVLCYLQGLTHDQAADRLGWPVGTVRRRLAWARDRLRGRLGRRGMGPSALLAGLLDCGPSSVATAPVPTVLAESTVRGALCMGSGKAALAGIVSVEAVALMEGVSKAMMTKMSLLMTTALVAGLVTAGAGAAAYSALGPVEGHGVSPSEAEGPAQDPSNGPRSSPGGTQKASPRPPIGPSPEMKLKIRRRSEDSIHELLRDYEKESDVLRKEMQKAKTPEERQALISPRRANPAAYAGALLYEAEAIPGTPAAEEALLWIVSHLPSCSMAETAKEMIVRDHIRSERLDTLFTARLTQTAGSPATERLLREVMARSPHRRIRAVACYSLATYLESQASGARIARAYEPAQLENLLWLGQRASRSEDYADQLRRKDPDLLMREAEGLYERVVKEFADDPLPHPLPNLTGELLLPGRPTTYGEAARLHLRELRELRIGKPAPEIAGTDLDGRPMKLSDYRGRIVAIYFCETDQLRGFGTDRPAPITEWIRSVAERHANDPFALLGVSTYSVNRNVDRETFKSLVKGSGLPARFWWDMGPDAKPGPIQAAWNARTSLYVLDRHGVIRYKGVFRPELFEDAVATLLKEQKDEAERSRKKE